MTNEEKKPNLILDTRKEYNTGLHKGWHYNESDKRENKAKLKRELQRLYEEIQKKRESIKNIKPESFANFKKRNAYEDWIIKLRKHHRDEYNIIENKDSSKVEHKMNYKNICPHCGKEDTIWPIFRGRKRFYVCGGDCPEEIGGCGKITRGITKEEWERRKEVTK